MKNNNFTSQFGFTLIEVMVVVIVLSILSGIAIPSYQNYMKRGYRADAKSLLVENAQFMERNFTVANRYHKDSANSNISLPDDQSPREGSNPRYTLSVTATTTTFTLTATPVNGGVMATDSCGSFTLNHLGQKRVIVNGTTDSGGLASQCWNK